MRNEVLRTVKKERNVLRTIEISKTNWIGHILRRNCLLKQCFSTADITGAGPWHQLYRAARSLNKLQYATRFN